MTTSPGDSALARAFEDGRYAWTRARGVRRRLVLGEAGLLAALTTATLAASAGEDGWTTTYFFAWTIGLLGFIPLHSLLNLGIRGLFDRSGSSLDEHQRRLREQSYSAVAWGHSLLYLAAATGGITVVSLTGHTDLALCLGFLLWLAASLLAYWHLAWTLPDEEADEDGEAPAERAGEASGRD